MRLPRSLSSRSNLQSKLMALLIAVALIPVGVIGVVAYHESADALTQDAGSATEEIAFNASDKLDRNLFERYGDVQAFASSDVARSMDAGELRRWMDSHMSTYTPIYTLMVVADLRGRVVATNSVDLEGKPLAAKGLEGRSVKEEAWFKNATSGRVRPGRTSVEDLHRDPLTRAVYGDGLETNAMSFTAPIRDEAGRIVGVWSNRFNWEVAREILAAERKRAARAGKPGTDVLLLDAQRTVLASKDRSDVLRRRLGRAQVFPSAGRGESGFVEEDASAGGAEARVVGYYRSAGFGSYPGLGWTAVARENRSEVLTAATALRRSMLLLALATALVIGLGAFLLARALSKRIGRYSAFARQVSEGDLTARLAVQGNDELADLGRHLNEMVEGLGRVSTDVKGGAQAISASAGQILATVNEHTASASQQSAAIVETTSSVEQVRVAAEQAAAKAEEVATQAQLSVKVGDDGFSAVEDITTGMSDIQAHVNLITRNILNLSEQTQQIGDITTSVSELAGQSNLLAFNAAIEAAKAGEHGKGFAVVAEEVRNLAEQSKQATVQVQGILAEIQKATRSAVEAAQDGTATVQANTGKARRAGEVIGEMADINRGASQAAQQISALARQQSVAMDQIAQAMTETGQATQQFVDGANDSQTAAEQLDGVARELRSAVGAYKV